MKFEVRIAGCYWEVGYFKREGGNDWQCWSSFGSSREAYTACTDLNNGILA